MVKTIGMMDVLEMTMMQGEGNEVMLQQRLFYMGVVHSLKESVEVDNETQERDSFEEGRKMMEKELGELIEKVSLVKMEKKETNEKLLMIRKEMECLGLPVWQKSQVQVASGEGGLNGKT